MNEGMIAWDCYTTGRTRQIQPFKLVIKGACNEMRPHYLGIASHNHNGQDQRGPMSFLSVSSEYNKCLSCVCGGISKNCIIWWWQNRTKHNSTLSNHWLAVSTFNQGTQFAPYAAAVTAKAGSSAYGTTSTNAVKLRSETWLDFPVPNVWPSLATIRAQMMPVAHPTL